MFHLREDEGVAAVAVLDAMLLALWANHGAQQVGQVGEGQGQQAAHVRVKKRERGGREARGENEFAPPDRTDKQVRGVSLLSF